MALKTGTHDISTLLATINASAVAIGANEVAAALAADNANHNQLVQDAISDFAAVSADRQRVPGSSLGGDMLEADEYSRIPTQKDVPAGLVGFPLRKYQYAVGWTKEFEKNATPNDFAIRQAAAQKADLRRLRYQLQKAIFTPTNSTFTDRFKDNAALAVKALINADSSAIQEGPNGEVFDGATHTHYNGSAALDIAAINALITDVLEHGYGNIRVFINVANEAAFRVLVGFVAYLDPRLTINANANQPDGSRLDITRLDNRAIGIFGASEVWVKPWVPANYAIAADVTTPAKPFVMRVAEPDLGLHFEAEIETFPLRAQYQEHMFGFGAWNRLAMAVLKFDNATYAAPTLTL